MISKCSGLGVGAALVLGVVCLNCGSAGSEDKASGANNGPGPSDPALGNPGSSNGTGGSSATLPGGGINISNT